MKRPGGPSGEEPEGEERDDEGSGEDRRRKGAGGAPGRGARRSLAARVSGEKPGGEGPAKRRQKTKAAEAEAVPGKGAAEAKGAEPKADSRSKQAKPKADAKLRAAKPNDDAAKKPSKPAKAAERERVDEAKRKEELHRPRRQPDAPKATSKSKVGEERRKGGDVESPRGSERGRGRRRRRGAARRVRGAARSAGAGLKRGAVATRKQVATHAPRAGNRILAALVAFYAVFFTVLGRIIGVGLAAVRVVAPPIRRAARFSRRVTDAASRIATPARVLALVVAGAAILLALSQYADYRSISIGNGAYSGVQAIAPAPETARVQTGDAHSYVFVPIAFVSLLLLAGAMTGRWRLCRLISLAGLAAIVVALVVDRPAGLDVGDVGVAYEGVKATLIGGFYAQIAAGLLLTVSSSLLARELRLAAVTADRPDGKAQRRRSGARAHDRGLRSPPADAGGARA